MPGRHITDQQLRLYMQNREKHSVPVAAAKSGFSASTGYRIETDPRLPSEKKVKHERRRPDPLAGIFIEEVVPMLQSAPGLRTVGILRELRKRHPELGAGIRRTLERRISAWRALHGEDQEVIFRQVHEPGHMGLSDFTHAPGLKVTIAGVVLDYLLYHFRLAYSGFEHAQIVEGGESFAALTTGLQNALWSLGGAPRDHRTDSLSAAFRNINADSARDMTDRYEALCAHYGMKASRNNRGVAHENGAVEGSHGDLKRELEDALLLRGTRDFPDVTSFAAFLDGVVGQRNARRIKEIAAERESLLLLPRDRQPEGVDEIVRVTSSGGFTLRRVFYTVPSRLIGHRLRARLFKQHIELFLGGTHVMTLPRVRGQLGPLQHVVNYRHVIHSLRRKPGALPRLIYRDQLFPRDAYRKLYHAAMEALPERDACRLTVELLSLAHERNVEAALADAIETTLNAGSLPTIDEMRVRFAPNPASVPQVNVDLGKLVDYDQLISTHRQVMA
ncbi:IS21 family transposase [Brucella rhizosphaerae]|uniref:IS21 family transposase n=1 Tax=Brucella rhizosphaerae TaxID=571254 RepID=UPI003615E367